MERPFSNHTGLLSPQKEHVWISSGTPALHSLAPLCSTRGGRDDREQAQMHAWPLFTSQLTDNCETVSSHPLYYSRLPLFSCIISSLLETAVSLLEKKTFSPSAVQWEANALTNSSVILAPAVLHFSQ